MTMKSLRVNTDILVLILLCAIFLAPPIMYGYIYPTAGGDTWTHLEVFDRIKMGIPSEARYWGLVLVGIPIVLISKLAGATIDSLFLWMNFAVLIAAGFTIYFVVSRLVDKRAGLLSMLIALFCTRCILFLFWCGTIFNIINMYIILPWGIFFFVKWIKENKWLYAIVAFCLFLLLSGFHPSSTYLPVALGLFTGAVLIYKLISKEKINAIKISIFGIITIPTSIILSFCSSSSLSIGQLTPKDLLTLNILTDTPNPTHIFSKPILLYQCIGLITILLIVFAIIMFYTYRKNIKLCPETRYFLAFLGCLITTLGLGYTLLQSVESHRVALDLSTFIAIATACLLGIILTSHKSKILLILVLGIIAIGMVPVLGIWFSHQSSMRPADIQAVEYVNSLDIKSCSYSTQIIPPIYNRFIEKDEMEDGTGDVFIYRDISMNSNARSLAEFVPREGEDTLDKYNGRAELGRFEDGRVTIYVFDNGDK